MSLLKSLLKELRGNPGSAATRKVSRSRPALEELEDRAVPSATPTVDLTTVGSVGQINGAIFRQFFFQPAGSGVIDAFVRLQAKGAGTQVEQGYNTDARPVQFDENTSPIFTRSLPLSSVPLLDIGGVKYREFLLDINQKASQPLLSLDQLRLYTGSAGNLVGYDPVSHQLAGLNPVYDMTAGGDNWVKLNGRLGQGTGKGNMLLYVPDSVFAGGGPYVYLYSDFGQQFMANAGFEQWAVGGNATSVTAQTGNSSGTISGTITGSNGLPLADVVVFLDTNGTGVLNSSEIYTVTDANGNYTFTGLTTGLGSLTSYRVGVVVPSSSYQTAAELIVSLQESGQQASGVNFTLVLSTSSPTSPGGSTPTS